MLNLQRQLMAEKQKVFTLEEEKNKWNAGYLDTAGLLNRDNVKASIDWDIASHIGPVSRDGAEVNKVVDAVWVGLRNYASKGSQDLESDLVNKIHSELPNWKAGNWYVTAGLSDHKMHNAERTWWLSFEFATKNFRILCAFKAH